MKKLITLILVAVLMVSFAVVANAAFGTVVEAQKVAKQPNLEEIDESWGDPVVTGITSATPNTWLWKYWNEWADTAQYSHEGTGPDGRTSTNPEDLPIDLYLCWDDKYFYFAIDVRDDMLCGSENKHRGDGVQLWLQPAESVVDPTQGVETNGDDGSVEGHIYSPFEYIWTLAFDDWSTDTEDIASELMDAPIINADFDDRWQGIIAIPWSNFGIKKGTLIDGDEFAIAFMRVSSTGTLDEGYSGGLNWGKFLADTNVWGKSGADSLNTVVLRDPATAGQRPVETEAPATEAPATEAPATEAPATEAPATEAPATEAPATEAPATEAPATEAPATEAPATEAPATEAPATEAPATEAPATEAPATEAPVTEAPATEAPVVDTPAEKNNTGLIIGIVAAVVVVGAVLGIVLGKKKK